MNGEGGDAGQRSGTFFEIIEAVYFEIKAIGKERGEFGAGAEGEEAVSAFKESKLFCLPFSGGEGDEAVRGFERGQHRTSKIEHRMLNPFPLTLRERGNHWPHGRSQALRVFEGRDTMLP